MEYETMIKESNWRTTSPTMKKVGVGRKSKPGNTSDEPEIRRVERINIAANPLEKEELNS